MQQYAKYATWPGRIWTQDLWHKRQHITNSSNCSWYSDTKICICNFFAYTIAYSCISLHILCIFIAYLLHIHPYSCIFFAYLLYNNNNVYSFHIHSIFMHIHCILVAYSLHIVCIFLAYLYIYCIFLAHEYFEPLKD